MKKISIFLLGLLSFVQVFSQSSAGCSDTSYVRYLQFDIWAWQQADSNHRNISWSRLTFPHSSEVPFRQDILQYNYTSNPEGVKVVGLSVWVIFRSNSASQSHNQQEYLYLYDAQPDTFRLLAQVPWSIDDRENLREYPFWGTSPINLCEHKRDVRHLVDSIYDYYFDTPVVVHDSFYVGCSTNTFEGNSYYTILRSGPINNRDCPIPPILWRIYNHSRYANTILYPTGEWKYAYSDNFLMVLPIIEVIDSGYVPPCEALRGVYLRGSGTDTVQVRWTADSRYEKYAVHYCAGEFGPRNEGLVDTVYTNQWIYAGPDHPDELMTVYVCGICNDCDSVREGEKSGYMYFSWSQPQQISVPEDGELSGSVRLLPNPAKETVAVMSSYRIASLEVYDARGRRMAEQQVGGSSARMDVSSWPRGVYVVLLHTAAGTVAKRLVLE